jgi:hypothetical protein
MRRLGMVAKSGKGSRHLVKGAITIMPRQQASGSRRKRRVSKASFRNPEILIGSFVSRADECLSQATGRPAIQRINGLDHCGAG